MAAHEQRKELTVVLNYLFVLDEEKEEFESKKTRKSTSVAEPLAGNFHVTSIIDLFCTVCKLECLATRLFDASD